MAALEHLLGSSTSCNTGKQRKNVFGLIVYVNDCAKLVAPKGGFVEQQLQLPMFGDPLDTAALTEVMRRATS